MPERLLLTYKVEAEPAPPVEEEQLPPEEEAPKPVEATVTEVVSVTPPAQTETVDNTGDLLVSSVFRMCCINLEVLGQVLTMFLLV